jgi:NAD(P)-dependent dehydrogenase (short-subunit alcohol dehydrogenase family)
MDAQFCQSLFDVEGQVIVITGGGGVLCGTLARALARAGARVAVLDVRLAAAEAVAADIHAAGGEALALAADVLDKASVEEAAARVVAHWGGIDALINGAGGNRRESTTSPDLSFFDLPQEAFQFVFNLNFIGTLIPSQVIGRIMAEQGRGAILNIASINAFSPLTNIPAYSAAKAAVKNFTEWLAVHLCHHCSPGIRVNAIAPGFFLTEQNRYLLTDAATGEMTARGRRIVDHTPMGRYGDPSELVSTVLWLLSPGASFVHGITVAVDGGFSIYSGV